ncbi:MAG: hypothetical protein HGA69_00510 [Desulfobulbaceae bacterium]|nr:hypothetical protein [Desulfobulbaceae bacterium]
MDWVEISEAKGHFINRDGVVKNASGKIIATRVDKGGYLRFSKTIHVKIYRAVIKAFCKEEPNQCVRHLDGDKLNNSIDNLKWGSYKDNYEDSVRHGVKGCGCMLKGEETPNSKLVEQDIRDIRQRAVSESMQSISKDYPVSYNTIRRIVKLEKWVHIK